MRFFVVFVALCEYMSRYIIRNHQMEEWPMTENEIGKIVVDCAVKLHMELGPGLLESVYERLLTHRLQKEGL